MHPILLLLLVNLLATIVVVAVLQWFPCLMTINAIDLISLFVPHMSLNIVKKEKRIINIHITMKILKKTHKSLIPLPPFFL